MNPYVIGVLIGAGAVGVGVLIAVRVTFRRLHGACKRCWGSGDCPTCQGTFRLCGDLCPSCWGGACTSCGGTGIDLEQERV